MSINMSNVKAITLGGRNVKKIEDKNGNVLWEESKADTILITVGEGQDYTTTQYYDRIVLPSLNGIKSKAAKKIGISPDSINVTKIEIDLSTLYWYNNLSIYTGCSFSLSTSNPSYFGNSEVKGVGIQSWNTKNLDITKKLANINVTSFYGYVRNTLGVTTAFSTSTSNPHFCTSSSSSENPTFTIVVTYKVK